MSGNDDYTLCADDHSLGNAVEAIKLCSEVIMDCEGQDLGQEGGSLSLISFRTIGPGASVSYLIDVPSLSNDTLRPLFDIIQSTSTTKIVFDGRMDFSELFHGHSTPIRGVLDLQLADVYSRHQRGEDEEDRHRRLSPYIRPQEIAGQPRSYAQVQRLSGLAQCLSEHKVISDGLEDHPINHSLWLRRPLPEEYLRYAARDVYRIETLYRHFKEQGYLTDQLPAQSARYVTIWQDAKPAKGDIFRNHCLLPLQILSLSYLSTRFCAGCKRDLPQDAYSNNAWKLASKQQNCWVCRAVSEARKGRSSASRYDDRYDSDDSDEHIRYDSDDYGGYSSGDYGGYSS